MHKRQTSKRRQESSRANGAKSHGPVTPEGKQISSRNATTHGLLATLITLTPEDEEIFRNIHGLYVRRFQPRDQVEHDLVEQVVVATYRMRQVWAQETAILGLQMSNETAILGLQMSNETAIAARGHPQR